METINEILAAFLSHWPFIAVMSVFGMVGVVMNRRVFTQEQAKKRRPMQWFWWWMRKTLPLHPVLAGLVVGAFWRSPEPGVDGAVAAMTYFAFSGVTSVFAYEVFKGMAKRRGYDLSLPGESNPPAEPPQS